MCLSLPGRVLCIEGPQALVATAGVERWCNALMYPELKADDRVLTHAGLIIEIVSEERAQEIESGFEELTALTTEEVQV